MAKSIPSVKSDIFKDNLDFELELIVSSQKVEGDAPTTKNFFEVPANGKMIEATRKGFPHSDSNDSDIEEVLAESTDVILRRKKVTVKPDFFVGKNRVSGGRNSVSGDSMTYDPLPPSRKQIIGSTPETLKQLEAQRNVIQQLVPIFTQRDKNTPCDAYMHRKYPRAVTDYNTIEKSMVPIVPNGAVKKVICKEGRDEKLVVGDNVLINYYIYAEGSPFCVDSNKLLRKPHSFVLGKKKGGIPVIDLGTLSMHVKEVAAFLATPKYAYGKIGCKSIRIPPNKRVLCVIEVLSRLASPLDSSSIINLVAAERKLLGFEEIYDFSIKHKNDGNKDLANEKNARAMRKYLQAIACLQDATTKCDIHVNKKTDLLHTLFSNVAICGIRTGQMDVVIGFSLKSIELPIPEASKVQDHFRCAKAYYCEEKWREAKLHLEKAIPLLRGTDIEQEAKEVLKLVDRNIETLDKTNHCRSISGSSTSLISALSDLENGETKGKKKRSTSICASLLRRLSLTE